MQDLHVEEHDHFMGWVYKICPIYENQWGELRGRYCFLSGQPKFSVPSSLALKYSLYCSGIPLNVTIFFRICFGVSW